MRDTVVNCSTNKLNHNDMSQNHMSRNRKHYMSGTLE